MTKNSQDNSTRIAVPYYGTLSLLPSRLTRIFFLVEVDMAKMTIADLSLQVWDPEKEPSLSSWLKQMGTEGVICGDAYLQQKAALDAEGIWVQSQQEGEVHEVVERWMRSTPENGEERLDEKPKQVCNSSAPRPAMTSAAKRNSVRHAATRSQLFKESPPSSPAPRPIITRSKVGLFMEREACLG